MAANEIDNPTRERYVALANNYLGIQEGTKEHKALVDKFNNIQKKYTITYKSAWCATFVSLINILSGGAEHSTSFPIEINCEQMIKAFTKKKRYVSRVEDFIPQYGDTVFYDFNGNGKASHVGIIIEVTSGTSPMLTVIEGNKSDAVGIRKISYSDKKIIGYGLPRFR